MGNETLTHDCSADPKSASLKEPYSCWTLNPQPLNPKPKTLTQNPKPYTLEFEPFLDPLKGAL